jgi:CheY-like chemotaxis protein
MSATLLIVEDNQDLRDLLGLFLQMHGFEVIAAEDGEAALQRIRQHLPDLIITDIGMPKLDGIGLIRELRQRPETRDIPVLVLTAYLARSADALAAGATQAAHKPVHFEALLQLIQQLL